ncbi:ribonuclease H-like domain-containing protein [Tanacetum coccineum]
MTGFDPLSDVSHSQGSNINDLLVKLLGKLGDMGLTGSSHSAQATTNDQGHHKSVSLVQNPSVTTGPIAYNIGSVRTPTPCPIFYPPVQPSYYYTTTGPLGFVPAQQPNPIPQPTSVPPGFAYPTQPTLHPAQLGYSLICPAKQALQPGSMGPTLIPGQATTLPHAFVVGTLHDPSSGVWKMDYAGNLYTVTAPSTLHHASLVSQTPCNKRLGHQGWCFCFVRLGALTYFSSRTPIDAESKLGVDVLIRSTGTLHYGLQLFSSSITYLVAVILSQKKYAVEILENAHMVNCNPSRTPIDAESKLGVDGDPVSDPTLYQSLAGSLHYLTFTMPDISYAVQQVCLHMHDPREPHFSALKRILRYVQGTLHYGLQLFSSSITYLVACSDVDWAGCPTTRRSTSGYCIFLGKNLLSWSSKRQPTLSCSSAEADYRGVANVVAETCWLRNLLRELHTPLSSATLVYCDNVSDVYLSCNPVQHQRAKHIEIDIHFVHDLVAAG